MVLCEHNDHLTVSRILMSNKTEQVCIPCIKHYVVVFEFTNTNTSMSTKLDVKRSSSPPMQMNHGLVLPPLPILQHNFTDWPAREDEEEEEDRESRRGREEDEEEEDDTSGAEQDSQQGGISEDGGEN